MGIFDSIEGVVQMRKKLAFYKSKATANVKLDSCYLCKQKSTSFCKSHSVPQFCLKNIAVDGKVSYINTVLKNPCIDMSEGINRAGVFKIICRSCDSKWFQAYENPSSYEKKITEQIMAQISLKDSLLMLSKRNYEKELYKLLINENEDIAIMSLSQLQSIDADLIDHEKMFNRAKKICMDGRDNSKKNYQLRFYEVLNYVVPLAFQGPIALRVGFDKKIINDIYNDSYDYRIQNIHIGVFPLESKTVVFMFSEKSEKRYREFFKKFQQYKVHDKLGIINYIIFLYSENFFLSPQIDKRILSKETFKDIVQCETDIISELPSDSSELNKYNLENWNSIPNFLSGKWVMK